MKCDDSVLIDVLKEPHSFDKQVADHIASCQHCQTRLEALAADEDSWAEAAVALSADSGPVSSSVVIALDPELADDAPLQADPISLDFLDASSHPEMLGRIGRYDVERLIGAGGMGIVIKAFDTDLHRPVAVKVLAPHLAHSGAARQRFAREARSAAAVVHENVVPIHNVDTEGKLPFIVMRYVAGESLQGRVDRLGPLTTNEVLRIGAQIANGLAAAHEQGLVHRDVKPGNVLLEETVDRVLISDFGLARAADDASVTRSGLIAGTPHYMSPEQARGDVINVRSDLFGLGSVLYFMCCGHPPFRANGAMGVLNRICNDEHRPIDEVNDQVPGDLAELIDELLAKAVEDRPDSAASVAQRLTNMLHSTQRKPRHRKPTSRRRIRFATVVGILGIILTSIAIGIQWGISNRGGEEPDSPLLRNDEPVLSPFGDTNLFDEPPVMDRASRIGEEMQSEPEAQPTFSSTSEFAEPNFPPPAMPDATPQESNELSGLFRDPVFYDVVNDLNLSVDQLESYNEDPFPSQPFETQSSDWNQQLQSLRGRLQAAEQNHSTPNLN